MPAWSTFLLFVAVAVAASFTPGPAVMLSIHNALHYGWRHALRSSLGNISGLLILALLSALGVNAVLQASALAFTAVKVTGALYLIWLGVQQWRRAGRAQATPDDAAAAPPDGLYRRGVMVALTNPKAIAFMAALFPQFLDPHHPLAPQYAALTMAFMTISLLALSSYAALAVAARRSLSGWFASGWPQRVAGGVFCAFGIALLRLQR